MNYELTRKALELFDSAEKEYQQRPVMNYLDDFIWKTRLEELGATVGEAFLSEGGECIGGSSEGLRPCGWLRWMVATSRV